MANDFASDLDIQSITTAMCFYYFQIIIINIIIYLDNIFKAPGVRTTWNVKAVLPPISTYRRYHQPKWYNPGSCGRPAIMIDIYWLRLYNNQPAYVDDLYSWFSNKYMWKGNQQTAHHYTFFRSSINKIQLIMTNHSGEAEQEALIQWANTKVSNLNLMYRA